MEWKGEVALMKSKDLNGRGFLTVNVKDKVAWGIMGEYAESV